MIARPDTFYGIKTCSCGLHHTRFGWRRLAHLGVQQVDFHPHVDDVELRNCVCGSTLAIRLVDLGMTIGPILRRAA